VSVPQVLFIGCDKGAWQMRGRQMAEALGARYTSKPRPEDWQWPAVIVLVKRAAIRWADQARASRSVKIWDVLDLWLQPEHNQRRPADVAREIDAHARAIGVTRLIGATRAMASAIGGTYLSHHCRLGLEPAPPRPHARLVGYDGSPRYLGSWKAAIEQACARVGLSFVLNPRDLREVDALVAFRGDEWDGEICRQWKSGVKYVNAIASGRPILTQPCAAYAEIAPDGGAVITDPRDLCEALAGITSPVHRGGAYQQAFGRARRFTVESIASQYREVLARTSKGVV
jgi:hypothetical protein